MKDQVIMSPINGNLAVAVPLFRMHHEQELAKLEGYTVSLTSEKPLAYVIDAGEHGTQLVNAEWLEKQALFLGEL